MDDEGMGPINRSRPLEMSGLDLSSGRTRPELPSGSEDRSHSSELPPYVPDRSNRLTQRKTNSARVEELPDMEEVQRDVASIVGTLRSLETDDPTKHHGEVGIEDLRRSVAAVMSVLDTARYDINARHKGYFTKDMDRLSGDVRRIVRDIERFERSRVPKELPTPNMDELDRAVKNIQKRSESLITKNGTTRYAPKVKGDRINGNGTAKKRMWRIGPFEFEPITTRMVKRLVPIQFGIMASVAYAIVLLRVVFDLEITHLIPLLISPDDIFFLLLIILGITVLVNIIHRLRIRYANRRGNPIWERGGQQA
ncbi:MAG: hypothetical protein ACMUHM_07430 [Thermoplasmatota archaeon]